MTNKGKILIIEDDEFLGKLCVKKIKEAGFMVSIAVDGEEGLKKSKEEKPDLILLDIVLPNLDGFETIKLLKKDPDTASIPVIFLTNLGQEDDIKRGLAFGANDYLVKAYVTSGEIVERVEKLISAKKADIKQ